MSVALANPAGVPGGAYLRIAADAGGCIEQHTGGADIRERAFQFAVRVVKLCRHLDEQPGTSRTLARQLVRSGTSIGSNLEEAQAGHSRADFVAKCEIARKEARETHYWLRLVEATDVRTGARLDDLLKEGDEIRRIIAAIVISARKNRQQ